MIEDSLNILRKVHGIEVKNAPKEHTLKTPDCPPLPRIFHVVEDGGTSDEEQHIYSCSYCLRVVVIKWRIKCPSLFEILACIVRESPNKKSIEWHIEDEQCSRCTSLFKLDPASWVSISGQTPISSIAFSRDSNPGFFYHDQSKNGSLTITVHERDNKDVYILAETPCEEDDGKVVRVEVKGIGDSILDTEIALKNAPINGCVGLKNLGPIEHIVESEGQKVEVRGVVCDEPSILQ